MSPGGRRGQRTRIEPLPGFWLLLYMRRVIRQAAQCQLRTGPSPPRRPELGSPHLNRDPYPLGAKASEDPLAQLVLHQELIVERLHVTDQGEVQGEFAEARDEARGRLGLG